MKKTVFLLVTLLAGCATGSRNAAPPNVYDFGPPARPVTEGMAAKVGARIALEVWAAPWLDTTHIDYRLNYDNSLKRRQYADSRWAASPRAMVAQQLRRQLGFASVNGGVAVDCLLRVELHEFSHVFGSEQESRGVLQGQFSLIDGKRRPVAVRPVGIEVAAVAANAQGGVRALVQSSLEMGQELAAWLDRLDKDNGLGGCGPGR